MADDKTAAERAAWSQYPTEAGDGFGAEARAASSRSAFVAGAQWARQQRPMNDVRENLAKQIAGAHIDSELWGPYEIADWLIATGLVTACGNAVPKEES